MLDKLCSLRDMCVIRWFKHVLTMAREMKKRIKDEILDEIKKRKEWNNFSAQLLLRHFLVHLHRGLTFFMLLSMFVQKNLFLKIFSVEFVNILKDADDASECTEKFSKVECMALSHNGILFVSHLFKTYWTLVSSYFVNSWYEWRKQTLDDDSSSKSFVHHCKLMGSTSSILF
jgi:hypothetical protein